MHQLNDGREHTIDQYPTRRIAFLVEEQDVGLVQDSYLGQDSYTFKPEDVGRLLEVVVDKSPGFISWSFTSIFEDLRKQYPDPFPYRVSD